VLGWRANDDASRKSRFGFNFNSKSHYFMMGAVVAENYMVFNSLKEFKLP